MKRNWSALKVKPEQLMLPLPRPHFFFKFFLELSFSFRDLSAITQCRRGWIFAFHDSAVFGPPIPVPHIFCWRERSWSRILSQSQMAAADENWLWSGNSHFYDYFSYGFRLSWSPSSFFGLFAHCFVSSVFCPKMIWLSAARKAA